MEEQITLDDIVCAGQAEETACWCDDPLNYKPFHYGSPCVCVESGVPTVDQSLNSTINSLIDLHGGG